MKLKKLFVAVSAMLCLSGAGVYGGDVATRKMTLLDAYELALKNSPTLASAQAKIAAATAQLAQANASYYPSVDFSAQVTRYRDKTMDRPTDTYDAYTNYTTGFSASYLVFDGFQRRMNSLIAELGEEVAIANCDDARRLLLEAVSQAFFMGLLEKDAMIIANEDAEFNRIQLNDAKNRYEVGAAKQSEVLNFELQVGNAEANYVSSERDWQNALVALGCLLTIDMDNIWINLELVAPPDERLNGSVDLAELLSYARLNRPDLRRADEEIRACEAGIKAAKGAWYPTLQLFGNYMFDRDEKIKFSRRFDRVINFGVELNWNVFNGGKTLGYLHQAEAELQVSIENRRELELNIESDVRQKYRSVLSNREQLKLQEKNLDVAKRIRDLVQSEYLGGTATITRLNEAQTDVTKYASARSQAYIQVMNSLEELYSTSGKTLEDYLKQFPVTK